VQKLDFERTVKKRNYRSGGGQGGAESTSGRPVWDHPNSLMDYGFRETVTTVRREFPRKELPTSVEGRRAGMGGQPLTRDRRMFNIITGGPAYNNNRFERWDQSRDYRRTGPPPSRSPPGALPEPRVAAARSEADAAAAREVASLPS